MINITQEQIEYLKPLIPELDDLINQDSDGALLSEIDWLIIDEYDEEQIQLSDQGIKLQLIYDAIFNANDKLT